MFYSFTIYSKEQNRYYVFIAIQMRSFHLMENLSSFFFFVFHKVKRHFWTLLLDLISLSNYLAFASLLRVFDFLFMCNALYEWNLDICKLYWEYWLNFYMNSLILWTTNSYIMIFIQNIPWIVNLNYAVIVNCMKWGS